MEKKVTIPEQKRIKSARSCVKEKITKTESTIRKTKTTTLGNQKRGNGMASRVGIVRNVVIV
jgi:hypothetical protein